MVKLFRKNRKYLLREGKTLNYLKYAIDEITPVVFCILISKKPNNSNESLPSLEGIKGWVKH